MNRNELNIDNKQIHNENWAEWVDMTLYGPASCWHRELILEILRRIKKGFTLKRILDVGCGIGINTILIAKMFKDAETVGTDISKTAIDCANSLFKLRNLKFVHDEDSSILNSHFDMVTCLQVLEHINEWEEFLLKITQSSNKLIMLSFPVGRMRKFEINMGHFRNFKHGQVEKFLDKFNFKPLITFYAGFPFYSPFYRNLCDVINAGQSPITKGKFGIAQKIASKILFCLFKYFSSKHTKGDLFCGLFERKA